MYTYIYVCLLEYIDMNIKTIYVHIHKRIYRYTYTYTHTHTYTSINMPIAIVCWFWCTLVFIIRNTRTRVALQNPKHLLCLREHRMYLAVESIAASGTRPSELHIHGIVFTVTSMRSLCATTNARWETTSLAHPISTSLRFVRLRIAVAGRICRVLTI